MKANALVVKEKKRTSAPNRIIVRPEDSRFYLVSQLMDENIRFTKPKENTDTKKSIEDESIEP